MSDIKITLSIEHPDEAFSYLEKQLKKVAKVEVVGLNDYDLRETDVFIGKTMTAEKLEGADRLKAVFTYKTGVEDFPLAQFASRGISLYNSHANAGYIAQYAFSLGAALVSRVAEFDRNMREGNWTIINPYWHSIFQMKVGVIGFGEIGREIYKLLKANDIPTYTVDRGKDYGDAIALPTLEDVCKECDLLMLALPNVKSTDNMFNKKIFALMKGKYIVNVGRGNCIDEEALYASLKKGELAGAAIDTWRKKARRADERLLPFAPPLHTLDNVLLSSHKAMMLLNGHERYVSDVLDNVLRYLRGETPQNAVDLTVGY